MTNDPDPWLPLAEVRPTLSGRLGTSVLLDPSSEWFSGHFEEAPLVPGVAILAFAGETVRRQGRREGRDLEVIGFSRVKFKRFVRPDERLSIAVDAMPAGPEAELPFDITCGEEGVARGFMKVRHAGPLISCGK